MILSENYFIEGGDQIVDLGARNLLAKKVQVLDDAVVVAVAQNFGLVLDGFDQVRVGEAHLIELLQCFSSK